VASTGSSFAYNGPVENPAIMATFNMGIDNKVVLARFTPQTLDQVLALVGGFASLIMTVFGVTISYYHNFNLDRLLIQSIYTQEGDGRDEMQGQPKQVIEKQLLERREYSYSFKEFFASNLICLCCEKKFDCSKGCVRRKKTHNETAQRLKEELDILGYLKQSRLGQFNTNIRFKPYQQWFISKFP